MNTSATRTILTLAAATAVWAAALGAGDNPPLPAEPDRREPPQTSNPKPARPADTDALVREFSELRQAYLNQRRGLQPSTRLANEQERQALRERLRALREEQARAREDLRQQLREMRDRLPSHEELIETARERHGSRPRRGD